MLNFIQTCAKVEEFPAGEFLIEKRLIRDLADVHLGALRLRLNADTVHANFTGRGSEESRHHLDSGGLSRAIRPEKSKQFPPLYLRREIIDCGNVSEFLYEMNKFDH